MCATRRKQLPLLPKVPRRPCVDLYDRVAVANVLIDMDGSIHTASPGDATSADLDSAVVDAVIDAFPVATSHTFRSAVCGSTGPTPPSPKTRPATATDGGVERAD